jgi:hypothetical protein
MSKYIQIMDASEKKINLLDAGEVESGITDLPSITIKNSGSQILSYLALAVLLGNRTTSGENYDGLECFTEKWIEAKLSSDPTYTPIGGGPAGTMLSFSPPTPGNSITVDLRLNIPSAVISLGNIQIYLEAFYYG